MKHLVTLAILASLLILGACGKTNDTTSGSSKSASSPKQTEAKETKSEKNTPSSAESKNDSMFTNTSDSSSSSKSNSSSASTSNTNQSDDMSYDDFIKMSDADATNYLGKLLKAHPELPSDVSLVYEGLEGTKAIDGPNPVFVGKTVVEAIKIMVGQSNSATSNTSSVSGSASANSSPNDKAVELVKAFLGTSSSKAIYEYDHMAGKYYIVHVYYDMEDHTATVGWYGVDVAAEKVVDITTEGESILK